MNTTYNLSRRLQAYKKVGLLASVIIALGSSIPSRAANVNWIAASPDLYTNTVDWSTGNLPAAVDTAVVGNATITNGSIIYSNNPGDPFPTNLIGTLQLGSNAASSGSFTMYNGSLTISNGGANALFPGNGNNSVGTFTMNGGNLTCIRQASTFFQDFLVLANGTGSSGTFTLNGGTANFICGIETGINGVGTINVTGGTLMDNGWFGVGRGSATNAPGQGFVNISGGTVYLLRNPGTDSGANGVSFCQSATNAVVNISGGSLYCNCFRFAQGPGGGRTDYETLNISGGNIYVGGQGFVYGNNAGTHNVSVTLSGGTFHTVDLGPNTGGTNGLASVGTDGTNWIWTNAVPATLATTPGSGTVTFAPETNRTITLNNDIGGTGNLAMTGPGTLVINGSFSYNGNTTITGGTVMGSGQVNGGTVTVSSSVTIEPGTTLAANTLLLGGPSGGLTLNANTNIIKLSGNAGVVGGGVNDLLSTEGNLNLTGVSTIQIIPLAPLTPGTPYTIIQYSGTPLGSGAAANLHIVSSSPRYSISLVDPSTTPGSIQILVTGNAANLVWKGGVAAGPTNWDNTTTNWLNTITSSRDVFYPGDAINFDDTAATNLVNVVGSQTPATALFTNNALAYTITGGTLGGPLDLEGTNSLTLQMSNAPTLTAITNNSETLILNLQNVGAYSLSATLSDNGGGNGKIIKVNTNTAMLAAADNTAFHGPIIVTNGTLQSAGANSLGYYASQLYVTNGGTFDINGVSTGLKSFTVGGSGYNGQGALINSSGNAVINGAGVANITLTSDTTFGSSNRWDADGDSGGFTGNGFNLTMIGPGTVILIDEPSTGLGNITVTAGRLGFQGTVDMGDPTKTATFQAGSTLTFFSASNTANPNFGENKNLVLNSATFDSGGSSNNFNGPVTLTGSSLFGTRSTLALWGPISGSGGFALGNDSISPSAGDLYLNGTNTYMGATTISNRTVFVGANSSLGSSSPVAVLTGANLNLASQPTFTFNSGQVLAGNGTIAGNSVVIASGAALAPGTGGTNASSLTVTGSLTLQAGSTNVVVVDKTATVTNAEVIGLSSVSIGGTLVVSNFGNALAAGDAIPVFSSTAYSGGFSQILPATPGAGLAWSTSTLTSDGNVRVISSGPPSTPTNITFSVSAGQLTLSWPSNYTGWALQAQTNAYGAAGIKTNSNWVVVPGSTNTNQMVFPISTTNGSVFYQMVLP